MNEWMFNKMKITLHFGVKSISIKGVKNSVFKIQKGYKT